MCGIVGILDPLVSERKIWEAIDLLSHRGPDDCCCLVEDGVALGHTRLSIIDLSSSGQQPMRFKNLAIVYNGEVFNYVELREELEGFGYKFKTQTDTEVVLKAFHCWGVKAVDRFIGMFAFAVYDFSTKELFLFRDRVGVKPIHYFIDGDNFAFSSEIRVLKKLYGPFEINRGALFDYFQYGYIGPGKSIYKNCHKLLPGHYMHVAAGKNSVRKYWDVNKGFEKAKFTDSDEKLIDQLEDLLISSFKYRMVSDVPVGVFLSGGIDSSLVAAILQKHLGGIHTFTIGFDEQKYDESRFAREVASRLETYHHEKKLTSELARGYVLKITDIYDEPFADSSAIPTALISRFAYDAGVKVVLSADGGDEIFCGYDRYWYANKLGKFILPTPKPIRKLLSFWMDLVGVDFASKFIRIHNVEHKYNQFSSMLNSDDWEEIYKNIIHNSRDQDVLELLGTTESKLPSGSFWGGDIHPMQGMMLWDFCQYLPDDILVKVDRATMYHSIEGREPLLDHRIVEFAARLPFSMKYRNGESKYILRKVLQRYVPKELFERPKRGFSVPVFEWFPTELSSLFEQYLTQERIKSEGILNYDYIEGQLNRLRSGQPVNINRLWFILVFEMWYEKWYLD